VGPATPIGPKHPLVGQPQHWSALVHADPRDLHWRSIEELVKQDTTGTTMCKRTFNQIGSVGVWNSNGRNIDSRCGECKNSGCNGNLHCKVCKSLGFVG